MRRRILLALLPFLLVVVGSTLGYIIFWHYPLIDAFYMTVITVATVGFREVRPLTSAGQLFTVAVILAGLVSGGYALTRITESLLEAQFKGVWEARRMDKTINALHGHTVLAGMGRVGNAVARTLDAEGADFVVVDLDEDAIQLAREAGWLFVQGDATEEEVLVRAGIERAGALITSLDTDALNLFVTVTARALSPSIFIVARSSHESTEAKMVKAGANRVLTPNLIGGRRMATMVLHPTVSDYLDLVSHGEAVEFRLQEVELGPNSRFAGQTLAQARVRETTGAYVLALCHPDGAIDANPSPESVMNAGDRLVTLGTQSQVDALAEDA